MKIDLIIIYFYIEINSFRRKKNEKIFMPIKKFIFD